uniref:Integrase, catalytic region, zinc finger, CCHC-type, peptidase aspartic, catalytic n=1 Tax=Tanacetum cinerariifolium TaxID=118510 RepID=A0A6L2KQP8_TANCI|nr:hypothetical protein [Tanacetum cinerariifolium]
MSWYSRCSSYGGLFNDRNCRHCTNISFEDEPVYDSNPNSYNQTPKFSYPPSQRQTSSFDQFHCFGCGDPLEEGQLEQVANLSTYSPEPFRYFNSFCYDDDDYEESTIPLNSIVSLVPPSIVITPVLPNIEPDDFLIMRDEELSTIPEKESDEFIKSSVEDLVPIPSEFEDIYGSDSECDLPSCDNFSPINVFEKKSVTFSNPLFDLNDDFTSSDDESLSDEDVPEENNIDNKDSYDSNLDEPDLLVTPLFDANEDECFDRGDDVDDIELLLHCDPFTPKMSVAFILEGFTNEPHLEENDDLFDLESKENIWKKILYDAQIDEMMNEDKVFYLGIHEKKFSPTYRFLVVKVRYTSRFCQCCGKIGYRFLTARYHCLVHPVRTDLVHSVGTDLAHPVGTDLVHPVGTDLSCATLTDLDTSLATYLSRATLTDLDTTLATDLVYKASLADKAILSGTENRPPMLEKDMYDSWRSRMELYMLNRQHGRMILESVEHAEAIQADCDVKATNIILQALPPEIYALVSTHKVAKDLWERIQMLMQGTSLTKQERECKLYDAFDKFTYQKGETLRDFYLRFSLLLNDMNMYNMKLEQF